MTTSIGLGLVRAGFKLAGLMAQDQGVRFAERLWFYPRRHTPPAREDAAAIDAIRLPIETAHGTLAGYEWLAEGPSMFPWERRPDAPTVLLVHGWEGRATQLHPLVAGLVAEGWRAIGVDLPAHGRSPGDSTDVPAWARVLEDVAARAGRIDAVVAHSMGAPASMLALARRFAPVQAAVLIGAPWSLEDRVSHFAAAVGLDPALEARLRLRVRERIGDAWTKSAPPALAPAMTAKALVVHDEGDLDVPFDEGYALAAAWPGARLLATKGLGHRRVLRDEKVVAEVAAFLKESVSTDPRRRRSFLASSAAATSSPGTRPGSRSAPSGTRCSRA